MTDHIEELLTKYFELGVAEGREGRNHDTVDGDAQRVRAALTAALAAAPEGKVKPLDWRQGYRNNNVDIQVARTMPLYQVRTLDGVVWLDAERHQTIFPSEQAAKAAAQADYEARILSALAPTPETKPESWTPTHRHVKRGSEYEHIGTARIQSDTPLSDMDYVEVYLGREGDLWARRQSEFHDGRFSALAPHERVGVADGRWATVRVEDTGDGLIIHEDDAKSLNLAFDAPMTGYRLEDGRMRVVVAPTTPAPQGGEKGEPVAWMHPTAGWVHKTYAKVHMHCPHSGEKPVPLYTHPAPTRNETLENLLYRIEPFISAYEIIATRPQDYHPSVARIGGLANARDLRVQDFQRLADAVRALSTPADGGKDGN